MDDQNIRFSYRKTWIPIRCSGEKSSERSFTFDDKENVTVIPEMETHNEGMNEEEMNTKHQKSLQPP